VLTVTVERIIIWRTNTTLRNSGFGYIQRSLTQLGCRSF
jgi:hypothetical protein